MQAPQMGIKTAVGTEACQMGNWCERKGCGRKFLGKVWSVSFWNALSQVVLCCVSILNKAVFLNDSVLSSGVDKCTTKHFLLTIPGTEPC